MLKSLCHASVAMVAAVGIAVTPAAGLAIAEPTDDTVVTTPLPPPAEIPPPEAEAPPLEPPAEAPPPADVPAELPPADPPPAVPPVEEVPPSVEEQPDETTPPSAEGPSPDLPSTEPSVEPPPAEEPPTDPPPADTTAPEPSEEISPPATDSLPDETTLPAEEETSPSGVESVGEPQPVETSAPGTFQPGSGETPADQPQVDETESSQPPAEQDAVTSFEAEPPVVASAPEPRAVDQADVQQAFASEPLVEQSQPVPSAETDRVYEQIQSSLAHRDRGGHDDRDDHDGRDRDHDRWDGKVRPWSPDWVKYDDPRHRGPVFCNPYHDRDIKIIYVHQGHQYVRVIPPGRSIVVEVVNVQGVHSFTAVHVKLGNIVDVNIGTFHHPAYVPPVQQNVHVKVVVNNHYYPRPFTVKKVVDCGYDQVRRKTRVVFDDTYVAWGNWRGHGKDRHFALEESATYPGMYGKSAEVVAAPPEPYVAAAQPRRAAVETNLASNEGLMILGGAAVLALAIAMLARALIRRNGSPPQHS